MTRKNEQERFMSYITERQTHESRIAVADFLRKYADRYHNSDFISSDPVQFPHRYHFKADIEISAFLTAFLSFGARPQILKGGRTAGFHNEPAAFAVCVVRELEN